MLNVKATVKGHIQFNHGRRRNFPEGGQNQQQLKKYFSNSHPPLAGAHEFNLSACVKNLSKYLQLHSTKCHTSRDNTSALALSAKEQTVTINRGLYDWVLFSVESRFLVIALLFHVCEQFFALTAPDSRICLRSRLRYCLHCGYIGEPMYIFNTA